MHKRALIWIQITLTHTAFVCQHLNKSVHGSIYDRLKGHVGLGLRFIGRFWAMRSV